MRAVSAKAEKNLTEKFSRARAQRARARDVYDLIGFTRMYEDGTCEVEEGLWSQTLSFTDISYQAAMHEDQEAYFDKYCEIFNYAGPEASLELSILNMPIPREEIGHRRFFEAATGMEEYVQEYNNVLNDKMLEGRNNLVKSRFLTFSVAAPDYEEAVHKLAAIRGDLENALGRLGCDTHQLDGTERLEVIAGQLRPGHDFTFSYEDLYHSGLTAKDYVCPALLDFAPDGLDDCFRTEGTWGQVLRIAGIGSRIADTALANIIDLPFPVNISVHTQAAAPGQDVNYVKERLSWMDKDIADKQMRSVARGHDAGLIPQDLAYSKDEAEELLDQLLYKNQRLFRFTAAIYTFADTYEKLQEQVLEIIRAGKNSALTIDAAACQQKQGLNTVLPLGMNHMFHERHLTTAQLGMLMPFATLEIFLKSGGYYGQNHESKNLIILDRKTMSNPAGWIFGTPGSGKSFAVKREITNTRLIHPEDEIYIVDPNNEYTLLTSSLGGENFILSNSGGDRVNLFDFYEGSEEVTGEDPVSAKAETVMAICSTVLRGTDGSGLSAHDVSVVDRCVRLTYERFFDSPTPPTLGDFYETLCAQPDAGGLPGALELYVTGSAAAFNSATTVDIQRGMTCFSFKALGKNMRTFAMLVILDFVYNRMLYNFHRGVRTWVYVDEAQSMFDDPGVLAYFDRFWSEGRKFGLIPTAISQNADRVFANEQARTTLSNSDFLMLFRQAKADRALLASLLNLSSQQEKYIDKSCADGSGLLCVKAARVCFEDNFPKGRLYDLWNTKPEEIAERRRAQWMQRQTAAAVAAEAE